MAAEPAKYGRLRATLVSTIPDPKTIAACPRLPVITWYAPAGSKGPIIDRLLSARNDARIVGRSRTTPASEARVRTKSMKKSTRALRDRSVKTRSHPNPGEDRQTQGRKREKLRREPKLAKRG